MKGTMKILVVYATRGGVSRTCAEMLAEKLKDHDTVTLCNVEESAPSPADFDVAVVGGSIRMGKWNKRLKAYIKEHRATLESMPSAAFICCGFPADLEDYIETEIPRGMTFSLGVHSFGGEIKPEKQKGLDKLVLKMVKSHIRYKDLEENDKHEYMLPEIIPEHITLLADRISAL